MHGRGRLWLGAGLHAADLAEQAALLGACRREVGGRAGRARRRDYPLDVQVGDAVHGRHDWDFDGVVNAHVGVECGQFVSVYAAHDYLEVVN